MRGYVRCGISILAVLAILVGVRGKAVAAVADVIGYTLTLEDLTAQGLALPDLHLPLLLPRSLLSEHPTPPRR